MAAAACTLRQQGAAAECLQGLPCLPLLATAYLAITCHASNACSLSHRWLTLSHQRSGGVLLDSKGRLIGINTAIADPTGGRT